MKKSLIALAILLCCCGLGRAEEPMNDSDKNLKKATFAGGCFWCMEKPYEAYDGIHTVISGYTGGAQDEPSYHEVSSGSTNHREAVQITYDPAVITYDELLDIFWRQIDPTDDGGQFADRGGHYTTAIFYHDDDQKQLAERSKQNLDASEKFNDPVVTQIIKASEFFEAEDYHQDYYKKNPVHYNSYYIGSGRGPFLKKTWKK